MCTILICRRVLFRMPSVVLTGGRARPCSCKTSETCWTINLPRLPRSSSKRSRPVVTVRSPVTASAAERAALQTLAHRLQRGNFSQWRSADHARPEAAAELAANTGSAATATDLSTGTTVRATPLSGTGRRYNVRTEKRAKRTMRGGFLPALIPIIAAAIGAIPGIAGTAVGIANLKEQQRQFNEQQKQFNKMYGKQIKKTSAFERFLILIGVVN
uniref:PX protein n=1 Tax=Northern Aplomado falcon adenovirus TaxID=415853 RepID=Q4KWK9_9ADEN|nr:pX protein [Northern Aplomado falcon adenovirus]